MEEINVQDVLKKLIIQECEELGKFLLNKPKHEIGDIVKFQEDKKYSDEYQRTYRVNEIEVKKVYDIYRYMYQCGFSIGDTEKRYRDSDLIPYKKKKDKTIT